MASALDREILPKILARYVTWAKVTSAVDATLPPDIQGDARRSYIARLAPNDINDPPKLYRALVGHVIERGWLAAFAAALYDQGQDDELLRGILQQQILVDEDGQVPEAALQNLRTGIEPFVSSFTFIDGIEAARMRVCAIWVDDGKTPAGLKGTGFLVAPDIVLTARHVVEGLLGSGQSQMVNGAIVAPDEPKPGSDTKLAFAFDYRMPASKFSLSPPPPGVTIVAPATNWLEWSSSRHPQDGVSHVFGPPDVGGRFDCAVIRLARPVGITVAAGSGGRLRGWIQLNGAAPRLSDGNAIAILQHPGGGPQMFDKARYKADDPSHTRIWYETSSAGGSSGSPCFDSDPAVVAFHNAGRPNNFRGDTELCNQGVRIDHVIAAMPPALLAESRAGWKQNTALWSISDDPAAPEPVLGRGSFKQAVIDLFDLRSARRVLVVEQAKDVEGYGKSGKSFSTRILRAIARGHSGFVVEFTAKEVRGMTPEQFLAELGRRIGITDPGDHTNRPTDERQLTRWWATDLPARFGQRLMVRARDARTAVLDTAANPATGSALGQEQVLRELIWIVIDDIDKDPPEGGIKELIAGMMAITDTASLVGPGLKSLRWLVIGHIPDFVRERSIQYVHDVVSQLQVGEAEWVECLAIAYLSRGRADDFNAATAKAVLQVSQGYMPGIDKPEMRLQSLAAAMKNAIGQLLKPGGGP